jgi:hypothetical protein
VGEAVRVITVFAACTIGIVVTLQNKAQVRALLLRRVSNGHTDALARLMQGSRGSGTWSPSSISSPSSSSGSPSRAAP